MPYKSSLVVQLENELVERIELHERLIAKAVLAQINTMPIQRHDTLSRRELQVMLGIAACKPWKKIAQEMKCSIKTVGEYNERIKQKLGLRNVKAVFLYAVKIAMEWEGA